ncbi:MAG: MMPL family transporter [Gammaproteobacteria bacterium]
MPHSPLSLRALFAAADVGRARHVFVWVLVLALLCAGASLRVIAGGDSPIGTDIAHLLPGEQGGGALVAAADKQNNQAFLHGMIFAVAGKQDRVVAAAAQSALAALAATGYRTDTPGVSADALYDVYRRHRFRLLKPEDAKALAKHPQKAFVTALEVGLASPGSPAGTTADPGGFLTRYLAGLPRPFPALTPAHGLLAVSDAKVPTYLLMLRLRDDAFGLPGEERAENALGIVKKAVAKNCTQCRVTATAPALFSAAERREAKREVNWLSIGSVIIIVLLILGFFRSLRPLALTVVCVAGGVIGGGAVTLLAFGRVNLLTLVFGTTLLGMAVDYSLHYLSDRYLGEDTDGTLVRIGPGILIAMTTTAIAFAFLAAAPFPALRQMAVFSIVGLISAFLTVCAVFPAFARVPNAKSTPAAMRWLARRTTEGGRRWRLAITILLVAGAIGGLVQLRAKDDLRELQALPPSLVAASVRIESLLGTPAASGFFLVRGNDLDAALTRERALTARAAQEAPALQLLGLAGFLPSSAAQARAYAAWRPLMANGGARLKQALSAAGLPAGFARKLVSDWRRPGGELKAGAIMRTLPALANYKVKAKVHGETGLIVQIYGKTTPRELAALAEDLAGVTYVNSLARINRNFTRIRRQATFWVISGYVLTLLLLCWRFGIRGGFATLLSPLVAAGVTLGILGWLGTPVNLFVVVALMLVAGVGVDYAVFLREGVRHLRSTSFAVALAAATTLAAFGLLGASRIPALHVFGLTVAVGIAVSWLVAPLTASLWRGKSA